VSKRLTKEQKVMIYEIRLCKADFLYFCRKYLKIVDANGDLVPLIPNQAQMKFLTAFLAGRHHQYILKARQRGLSTIISAVYFWRALFNPNHSVALIAHTDAAAMRIFSIYKRYWQYMPPWFMSFISVTTDSAHGMEWNTGSKIVCSTSNTESLAGSTFQSLHLSEFAKWPRISESVASILQTASGEAAIIFEFTAKGPNEAQSMWAQRDGYEKIFISWTADENAVSDRIPEEIPEQFRVFKTRYELSDRQLNWAIEQYELRCANNMATFNQEYPLSAEVAFITSGDKFFNVYYGNVSAQPMTGIKRYADPDKFTPHVMGIDTAGGSVTGDFSTWCVLAAKTERRPRIVSTQYERVSVLEFSKQALQEAKKYDALVVIELNYLGLAVMEYFKKHNYGKLYIRQTYSSIDKRYVPSHGFVTGNKTRWALLTKLQEYITKRWLDPTDNRLKNEINTFAYNDAGRPDHQPGKHDDLIFATGLALMGLDQISWMQDEISKKPPQGVEQIVRWEMETGNVWENWDFDANRPADGVFTGSELLDWK
jgi:hypothetical protein